MAKKAEFGFTKLLVADLERSVAFYRDVAGLEEQARIESAVAGRALSEIMLKPTSPGGPTLVLLHFHDRPRAASDEVILGFQTGDLDAFLARAVAAGGRVYEPAKAMPQHGVRVAYAQDLEGHLIEVVQPL
jgi:predicted enzyme related to lactoylglutathione lyase